jgi:hypothetical protein
MRSTEGRFGQAPVYIAVALLWLVTAVLGLAAVYYLHELAVLFYGLFIGKDYYTAVLIGQVSAIIGALIWLGSIIGSGEFHLKHAGQKKSWQIIAWMLAVEILIIAIGLITSGAI